VARDGPGPLPALLRSATLPQLTLGEGLMVLMVLMVRERQKATTQFNQPVSLQGVILKGEYLFIHDDAAMARGEACTFVYKGASPVKENLVASFHCIPAERTKVKSFTVRTQQVAGVEELREFQFSGDTEAHVVPGAK